MASFSRCIQRLCAKVLAGIRIVFFFSHFSLPFVFFFFFCLIRFVCRSNFHWPYHNYHYYQAEYHRTRVESALVCAGRPAHWRIAKLCCNYNYCEFYGV